MRSTRERDQEVERSSADHRRPPVDEQPLLGGAQLEPPARAEAQRTGMPVARCVDPRHSAAIACAHAEGIAMNEPEVSVPAVMRNYHEVLRNDLAKVLAPLADAADVEGFARAWDDDVRAIAVHAAMEDGVAGAGRGITSMLDQYFDGAAGAATFRDEHVREHAMEAAVAAALPAGADAMRHAFADYRAMAEAHLKHEEDVMMPLVARLPQPKAPLFASPPSARCSSSAPTRRSS
ncbi:MAG TPA: hemerythrin domain-containing protein [Gemmatimonadaceae bacterium]|nr:hemerythrin domain-containing protein [Gemmatimonadaceae bacterium]